VKTGDLLVPFSSFVYCFSLGFLDCDGQSDIHRVVLLDVEINIAIGGTHLLGAYKI
jgi:hypothetical protein